MTVLRKLINISNGLGDELMSDLSSNELEKSLTPYLELKYPTVADMVRDELEDRKK